MAFPTGDQYWVEALAFLEQHTQPLDAILISTFDTTAQNFTWQNFISSA